MGVKFDTKRETSIFWKLLYTTSGFKPMARSMTAFGRKSFACEAGNFVIEISSVNKRNLDFNFFIPKEFYPFEPLFRKWVSAHVSRGNVTIRLVKEKEGGSHLALHEVKKHLDDEAKRLNLEPVHSIESLATLALSYPLKVKDLTEEEVKKVFDEVTQEWCQMKEVEGAHLVKDLVERLKEIGKRATLIEGMVQNAPEIYREKISERLQEVMGNLDEERVIKEVVIFSEKVDTTEEIIRLKSHLAQFEKTLNLKEAMGRKLDFLIQEMNREVNSLGVKCLDLEIVKHVLEIKSELEKVREQVQNIE